MPKRKAPEPKELTWRTEEELEVERQTGHRLTMRQKRFADRYVEGDCSATQAAIEAGYNPKGATNQASRLLNPKETPAVAAYIAQLREDLQARYGVTKDGMLKRLYDLSRGAEGEGQFSAAINAEKTRASLAGLTIDRRETINTVQDMTKDQVLARLEELKRKHPYAFIEGDFKDVTNEQGPRGEPLAIDAEVIAEGDEPNTA
jgi:phage terminase small subunit